MLQIQQNNLNTSSVHNIVVYKPLKSPVPYAPLEGKGKLKSTIHLLKRAQKSQNWFKNGSNPSENQLIQNGRHFYSFRKWTLKSAIVPLSH